MKYLRLFEKQTDYQSFIESDNFVTPNVSFVQDENMVFYNILQNHTNLFTFDVSLLPEDNQTLLLEWLYTEDDGGKAKCYELYEALTNSTYNGRILTNCTIHFYDIVTNEDYGSGMAIFNEPYILFQNGDKIYFSKNEDLYKWAINHSSGSFLYEFKIGEHLDSFRESDFTGLSTYAASSWENDGVVLVDENWFIETHYNINGDRPYANVD